LRAKFWRLTSSYLVKEMYLPRSFRVELLKVYRRGDSVKTWITDLTVGEAQKLGIKNQNQLRFAYDHPDFVGSWQSQIEADGVAGEKEYRLEYLAAVDSSEPWEPEEHRS
jgi:hypothetical protein